MGYFQKNDKSHVKLLFIFIWVGGGGDSKCQKITNPIVNINILVKFAYLPYGEWVFSKKLQITAKISFYF